MIIINWKGQRRDIDKQIKRRWNWFRIRLFGGCFWVLYIQVGNGMRVMRVVVYQDVQFVLSRHSNSTSTHLFFFKKANLPYILWIAAFNTSFFLGYLLLLDIFFFPHPRPSKKEKTSLGVTDHNYNHNNNDDTSSFGLLNAINRHGLSVFLIVRSFCSFFFLFDTPTHFLKGEFNDGRN